MKIYTDVDVYNEVYVHNIVLHLPYKADNLVPSHLLVPCWVVLQVGTTHQLRGLVEVGLRQRDQCFIRDTQPVDRLNTSSGTPNL
jgi:hypothetical protein